MNFQLTINGDTPAELLSLLSALNGGSATEKIVSTKAVNKDGQLVEKKADKKAPVVEFAADAEETSDAEETPAKITIEALRSMVQERAAKKPAIKALLATFGAANLTTLGNDHYADFAAKLALI